MSVHSVSDWSDADTPGNTSLNHSHAVSTRRKHLHVEKVGKIAGHVFELVQPLSGAVSTQRQVVLDDHLGDLRPIPGSRAPEVPQMADPERTAIQVHLATHGPFTIQDRGQPQMETRPHVLEGHLVEIKPGRVHRFAVSLSALDFWSEKYVVPRQMCAVKHHDEVTVALQCRQRCLQTTCCFQLSHCAGLTAVGVHLASKPVPLSDARSRLRLTKKDLSSTIWVLTRREHSGENLPDGSRIHGEHEADDRVASQCSSEMQLSNVTVCNARHKHLN